MYNYLQISEVLKANFAANRENSDTASSFMLLNNSWNNTAATAIAAMQSDEDDFKSLQYALFTTSFVEVLGGFFFLCTALYVLRDKMLVDQAISGKYF